MKQIDSVLIIEDEILVARSIAKILMALEGYQTFIVDTKEEAIKVFNEHSIGLIISDINLNSPFNGIQIVEELQERNWVPVIYLTAYSNTESIMAALQTEPICYLVKPFTNRQLEVACIMAENIIEKNKDDMALPKPTTRELLVVQLLADGMNSKRIAENLFVSEHTVKTHRRNLLKKYNLSTSSELISLASKLKWIKN